MQVSNTESPNVNGKVQVSQPVGVEYVGGSVVAVQTARNPGCVPSSFPSDLNFSVTILVFVIMLHG